MSQRTMIINHLSKGFDLTRLKALKLGMGMSLNSRIPEIESMGYPVQRETITTNNGKRVSRYWFDKKTIRKVLKNKKQRSKKNGK